jgi:hypothetical protein
LNGCLIVCNTGELGEHGVSEGVKAVDKYEIANNLKSSASKRRKIDFGPISSTLPVLSVDLVGAMLIRQTGRIVNRKAAVYFTGLILYIAAEVLDVAGNEAKDCKADIISPRHITLAIRGDEDLDTMFPGLILGGGLMPHIHKISALPMDELLKGSDEDKAASHREFVSFDAGEERGMVATNLFAKHFHGEGEHPRGISADSQGLPRKTVGQAEEKAPSISDRLLRLVAVIPLPSVVLPLYSARSIHFPSRRCCMLAAYNLFVRIGKRVFDVVFSMIYSLFPPSLLHACRLYHFLRRRRLALCALASAFSTCSAAVL